MQKSRVLQPMLLATLVALFMGGLVLLLAGPSSLALPFALLMGAMTGYSTWLICHLLGVGVFDNTLHMVRLPVPVEEPWHD